LIYCGSEPGTSMELDDSSRRVYGIVFFILSIIIFYAAASGLYEYYLTGHISFG